MDGIETQFSAGGMMRTGRAPNPTAAFLNPRRRRRARRQRNAWERDSIGHTMAALERHGSPRAPKYRTAWERADAATIQIYDGRGRSISDAELEKIFKKVKKKKKVHRGRAKNPSPVRRRRRSASASPVRRRRYARTSNPSPVRRRRRRSTSASPVRRRRYARTGNPTMRTSRRPTMKRIKRRRRNPEEVMLRRPEQLFDAAIGLGVGWGAAGAIDTLFRGGITKKLTTWLGGRSDRADALWSAIMLGGLWFGTKYTGWSKKNRTWILGGSLARTVFQGLNATLPTTGFSATVRSVMALPSTAYTVPASNERRVILDATTKQLKDASTGEVVTAKQSGTDYVDAQNRKLIDNRDGKLLTAEDMKEFGLAGYHGGYGSFPGGYGSFPGGYGSFPGGYGRYANLQPTFSSNPGGLGAYAYLQPQYQGNPGGLGAYAYLQPQYQGNPGGLGAYVANPMPVPQQRLYAGEAPTPLTPGGFSGNGASNASKLGISGRSFGTLKRAF